MAKTKKIKIEINVEGDNKSSKQTFHDFILLDRSGSMGGRWKETIGTVNHYVRELKKKGGTGLITVATFDRYGEEPVIEYVKSDIPLEKWEDIPVEGKINPRGMTPLYDAVGILTSLVKEKNPDRSTVVIVTDGEENNSRKETQSTAKAALDSLRKKDYLVLMLGADFENMKQAEGVGNLRTHTMAYNTQNFMSAANSTATASATYRSGVRGQSVGFTDEDRENAVSPKSTT